MSDESTTTAAASTPPAGAPSGEPSAPEPQPVVDGPDTTPEPSREELVHEELRDLDRKGGNDPLRGSRTSGFYASVIGLGVVLVLLIIFIAQNTRKTTVSFLAWDAQLPVAVAMLIAAVAGLFLAGLAGTLRILQLRRRVRRVKKAEKRARR
jgi:uncharacterized integral membrane protein